MRILIAGKFAPDGHRPMGGSQSWIDTVANELKKRGHDVELWEPGRKASGTYDLGIIQHLKHTRPVVNSCKRTIQIVHGIIDEEKPGNCDVTAFVSEGVRDHWGGDGPIVRQPIDLAFWQPQGPMLGGGVIRFSYRQNQLPWMEEASKALGYDYKQVHSADPEMARYEISKAAAVVATGRAALEAMACNKPVVIYDNRSAYQKPLMGPCQLDENMRQSYSGRGGHTPDLEDCKRRLKDCVLWPPPNHVPERPRAWIERHHDARRIVDQLLSL